MLIRLVALIRGLTRRPAIDDEVDEELAFHLEQETAAHVRRGVAPDEARRLAVLALGGLAQTRDAVRDVRTTWVETVWRETHQGVRTLCAAPTFTLTVVLVLALGIGANTAVFSVLEGVLLRPLPYPQPDELVRVWSRNDERQIPFLSVSPADFEAWQRKTASLGHLAAYERPETMVLAGSAEQVTAIRATPGLFPLLGIPPALGRVFTSGDEDATAVIGFALWQRRFGGARNVLGRPLTIDDRAWTIVGVMPAGFDVPNVPADIWLALDTRSMASRSAHVLRVLGRRGSAGDSEAVRRDLDAVTADLARERPAENRGWSVTVLPLIDTVVSPEFRRTMWIIAGAVVFVLVMTAATVAGLLLIRATTRQRELAVRVALGASRGSLVRLLLLESLVLGAAAGLAGLLVAHGGVALLQELGTATVPRLDEVTVGARAYGFAATLAIVTAAFAGLLPAWRSTHSLHEMLRTRETVSERGAGRALNMLVVVEVGSAVLLVVGAALLVQTVLSLQRRSLGFEPANLLAATVVWTAAADTTDLPTRTEAAVARLLTLPGVVAAAAGSGLPFAGQNSGNAFWIEGREGGEPPDTDFRVVSPGYFSTLRIPIAQGRAFTEADRDRALVILSDTAAKRFWPGVSPLGHRLKLGPSEWLTIVGVAGDVRYGGLDAPSDRLRPMMYVPHGQMPQVPLTLVVRARVRAEALADTVRSALGAERGVAVGRLETMQTLLRQATASQRFAMTMLAIFAGAAVTLAAVGIYGVLALAIARRTKEIGVRFALGAGRWDVLRLIVGRTLLLIVAGIGLGLIAAISVREALHAMLFGVSVTDPVTYAGVTLGFLLLGIVASSLPSLRALRVDPVIAIRAE